MKITPRRSSSETMMIKNMCEIDSKKKECKIHKRRAEKKLWIWNETEISSVVCASAKRLRDWNVGRLASSSQLKLVVCCLAENGLLGVEQVTRIRLYEKFMTLHHSSSNNNCRLTQFTQGQSKSGDDDDSWFD